MGISRQNRVEVKSMLTAVSSKPCGSGRVHMFTALDNAMSRHTVHVIFYYDRSPFGSFDLDSVRIPLSELLSLYPPAVGRLTKNPDGILEVKCNDAGLRVLKAKVSIGIDEWLRSADGDEESDLTAWEDMPEDPSTWSPFRLQNRVEVKSMLTAVSSKPTGSTRVHTFTALDNAMSPHTVHVIFYYARSPFGSFDLDSVRIPLSELLSLYPPAVGRVTKNLDGILEVKCNDAGLRVLKAKVSVGIDEWLRSADGHDESDLTAWEDMPEDPSTWSPFRLQINEFEGGGVAIGLSCPHMQADATTLTVLLKSWTEAQRRQCIVHPPFFTPLASDLTDTDAVKSDRESFSKPIAGPASNKTATATFRFSGSAFTRCVKEYSIDGISPKASPFDVFAALFWTRLALVKRRSDRVCVCVDFRRRLSSPLPYGFFGNALNFSSLEMANVVDMGIGHVARLVNEHVASLNVEKIRSDLKRVGSTQGKMYGKDLTIVNMEHMIVEGEPLMYEAVFENGVKPVHVSYRIGNDGGEGVIMVIPSPEKGFGRTVAVTLPEEEMSKLLSDQEILRLEPEIILNGVK